MKHAKRPTVRQCKEMQKWGLNPEDWLVERDTPKELVLVHRHSEKTTRNIPKGE